MGFPDGDADADDTQRDAHRDPRDPLVGTVINGKFLIKKAIARGGMGKIYLGTQAPLDRAVALKIVKADSINEDESQFLRRFLLEASILAKLQHPNVVTLFDYGRIEGAPVEMYFIAMEYLDGQTLTERLREQGALATYEVLVLFRQIARGLREAHSRGVVHRDLKPSNIVIVSETDDGAEIVKIVDFGIGKVDAQNADQTSEGLTRDGVLVGTPKYMAPEQFDGMSSPASDVYALGIIIYQCLTGVLPFPGGTLAELMIAKLQQPVPPMRTMNQLCDAPESVEQLVYRMLARFPDQRPTLDEVFALLGQCEEEVFGAASGHRLSGRGRGSGGTVASSRSNFGFPNSSANMLSVNLPARLSHTALMTSQANNSELPHRPSAAPTMTVNTATRLALEAGAPTPTTPSTATSTATSTSNMRAALLVAALFAFGSIVVVGGFFFVTRSRASHGVEPPTSSASSLELAPSFALHLDSTPTGATVTEGGAVLGVTPITITVDRASVANGATRTFLIKKDGWSATMFAQGPTNEGSIDRVVTLAAEPTSSASASGSGSATAAAAHSAKTTKAGPGGVTKTNPASSQTGDLKIRLER